MIKGNICMTQLNLLSLPACLQLLGTWRIFYFASDTCVVRINVIFGQCFNHQTFSGVVLRITYFRDCVELKGSFAISGSVNLTTIPSQESGKNLLLLISVRRYNMNNFSQFHTCCLSQFSFLQGKWSSKHSVLSLICWINRSIRFLSSVLYTWCCSLNHLHASLYQCAPSVNTGFLPYLLRSCLKNR